MDQFDSLTNNQLREELKSRGLGNFPVTDTTRNSLVKKLRNAVNGTTAKPVKNRRETINLVAKRASPPPEKTESDADKGKVKPTKIGNNRRATIGAGMATVSQPVVVLNGISEELKEKAVSGRFTIGFLCAFFFANHSIPIDDNSILLSFSVLFLILF